MAKICLSKGLTKLLRGKPVIIITTFHPTGIVNAGTFGAYTNLSPTEVGIAIGRPSHTYQNIKRTGELVLNVVTRPLALAAEVCAEEIPPTESELDKAGLHSEPSRKVKVPLIKECVVNIECQFLKELEIGYHSLVVVKCLAGHIEEEFLAEDGGLDVVKAEGVVNIAYPRPLYAVLAQPFLAK
ncbi:MAG: flavin reductase family protein [Candidatus Omnitrophica bacterium]|nr:flavin reductase family protein [Candidatus Omnitrophota bacterium]